MKRAGSGRVARKVGAYDDDSADSANSSQNEAPQPLSVVKRPALGKGKGKKRSSLRISFGPAESDANEGDESSEAGVATPKKSNLGRIALEKSAQLRARSPLVQGAAVSEDEGRPSYSQEHMAELRSSTPTTPRDLKPSAEEEAESRALDIASKFGPIATLPVDLPVDLPSAIPSAAEIEEKKARRKRLAQEEQAYEDDAERPWASDDAGSDDFRQHRNDISVRPKQKYAETRLVHDDEDLAEGFDDFVEDGRIALGRKSEREAQRKRRADMAALIHDAEGSGSGSSDSDDERNTAFAAAQARAGRYGHRVDDGYDDYDDHPDGTKTPPRITPLPDLDDVLQRLHADSAAMQQRRHLILRKLEELKADRVRIEERKTFLQEQLQKTGDEYEKARVESGLPALPASGDRKLITERGLESLGTTPVAGRSSEESEPSE
ncbi:uncharacterized protein EKO05_0002392 [Ascochyta rabiei]|uniref:Spliceosomal complex disassembly n=1 Tax=Didymella rabiei TaxID=5454 RepID=A0A162VNU0_DIDRA|nr:uncharacterized protein EKO05_0002392 [Ascochyta rabiei]KZM18553.1 spliceosomal complex disassembly [Ascochyta rabiei]UPX11804.1 hypothetical protein EKO05_0002392 [Ascochyta rabiei]